MASQSLLPRDEKAPFPHSEPGPARKQDDNRRRRCYPLAIGLVALVGLGMFANCCAHKGPQWRHSEHAAEVQEVQGPELHEVPVLVELSAEEALLPIRVHRRQDGGDGSTPVPSATDGNATEPRGPTDSGAAADTSSATDSSESSAVTTTDVVTTTTQVTLETTTAVSTTTEQTQETSTTERTTADESTTTTQGETTSQAETTTTEQPETTEESTTTTTTDQTSTTRTTQAETTTTTEAEPSTTTDDREEEEPTSSAVETTLTSTLEGGMVTTLTSTSWVEVEPTSAPAAHNDDDGNPDLQNAAVAKNPALAMVFGLAAAAFLLS